MPTVPAAGYPYQPFPSNRAPGEPPFDYQNIQARPEMFGAGVGLAEQQAGERIGAGAEALGQAALSRQDIYNQVNADKAVTEYMQRAHKRLFGDPAAAEGDPAKTGLFALQGSAAMDGAAKMPGLLDKDRDDIAASLPNDYVRQLFNSETRRQRIYIDQQIGAHYQTASLEWAKTVNRDTLVTSSTNSALNHNNPAILQQGYTSVTNAAVKDATLAIGHAPRSDDPADQNVLGAALGRNYAYWATQVVDAKLAANDAAGAQKFIEDWQPVMGLPGSVLDELHTRILPHANKAEGEAGAAGAISGASGGGASFRAPPGPRPFNTSVEDATPAEQQMLNEIRYREPKAKDASAYTEAPNETGDSGAYQFNRQTWQENTKAAGIGTEYPEAYKAPPKVQDAVALWTLRHQGTAPWKASGPYPPLGGTAEGAPPGTRANFAKAHPDMFGGDPHQPGFEEKNITTVTAPSGATFRVNKVAAGDIQGFLNDLDKLGYKPNPDQSSGFNLREIRDGHDLSEHAYGNAIDLNSDANPMTTGSVKTDLPANISEIAARHHLIWGGNWEGRKDPMHFEWAGPGGGQWQVAQAGPTTVTDAPTGPQAPTPSAIPPLAPIIEEHNRAIEAVEHGTYSTPEAQETARRIVNEHYTGIEQRNRALVADEERQRVIEEKTRIDKERAASDKITSTLITNPEKVSAADIAHNPDLTTSGMKENLFNLLQKRMQELANPEAIKDYGSGFHDLWTRVHAPVGDPTRVTDPQVIYDHARIGGDLGVAGADVLIRDIFGRRSEEGENEQKLRAHFETMARQKILLGEDAIPGLHLRDPEGEELYQKFLGYFLPTYERARRGTDKEPGKSPEQLLTPGSPDYLGAVLDQPGNAYVRPMDEWLKSKIPDQGATLAPADLATPQALQAAVVKNPALRNQAILEAQKRGWIQAPPPPAPAPPMAR